MSKVMEHKQTVNEGHFHEIADRASVICDNIDDHLINHPGMTAKMDLLCEEAQDKLVEVMNLAWAERDKFLKEEEK